jgi:hypothetical protein
MIHFDFIVEDEDAELIFECINTTIRQANNRKLYHSTTQVEAEWLRKHVEYLNSLKKKMLNKNMEINKNEKKNKT